MTLFLNTQAVYFVFLGGADFQPQDWKHASNQETQNSELVVKGNTYAASFGLIHDRLDFLSDSDRDWMLCRSAEETFFQ